MIAKFHDTKNPWVWIEAQEHSAKNHHHRILIFLNELFAPITNKKKMEFSDPKVRRDFNRHVLSLIEPEWRDEFAKILPEFLDIIMEAEASSDPFPISLEKVASWIEMDKNHLKRLVDPRIDRARTRALFKPDKDFRIVEYIECRVDNELKISA
jgi:hypothetical protein